MSKNLFKKGLAFGAVLSLGVTGFTGIAASAATGDVTLAPKTGTGTSAFATDAFTLKNTVKTANGLNDNTLAYRIDNADQNTLRIVLPYTAKLVGINEAGASVDVGDNAMSSGTQIVVDFAYLDIVSLVIYDIATTQGGTDLIVELYEDADSTADSTSIDAASVAADRPEYDELDAATSVDVTAWIETTVSPTATSYKSIETEFASTKQTVTFIDPSDVSLISKVERQAGVTGTANYTVVATSTANATTATLDAGQTLDGVTLADGDLVLLKDQTTATQNGVYEINADGNAASAVATDLIGGRVVTAAGGTANAGKVYSGLATGNGFVVTTGIAAHNVLNAGGDDTLGGTLQFSTAGINLTQVDLSQWRVKLNPTATDGFAYQTASVLVLNTPAGQSAIDGLGKLHFEAPVTGLALTDGRSYNFVFKHSGDTDTVASPLIEMSSNGFQVVEAPTTATATRISASVTASADAKVGAWSTDHYPVAVRNGVSAVTYKSQIQNGTTAVKEANVPVLAIVTAGANLPTGASIQVSGANETIKKASGKVLVSGLTDSDGNWSVTVTSSDTSSAGSTYSIAFYVLDYVASNPDVWYNHDGTNDAAVFTADYAAGSLAASGFTADSSILSGANPTVTFTLKDQFGQPLSASSTGKAYSVELKAPNKTNLEQFAAVVGGKATFTFKNYVTAGGSEQLTAKVYTGTSTSPTYVSGAVVYLSLYNTNAVSGVNVVTEVTAVDVSYDDFITGASSSTNLAPTDGADTGTGEDFLYTGTVVDSNGAGVPGAPVTISGKGFQFVKDGTTTFYEDSITVAASEAGTFSVRAWTHVLSSAGNVITVKSGDKSASTKVKSVLPSALSAKNLQFSWTTPALTVVNTTYSVSASVTDKWNNPVAGATVNFDGLGSATINGLQTTVAKVTDKNGKAQVYLRSLKDIDGISTLMATLSDTVVSGKTWVAATEEPSDVFTDATATKWDESKWTNVLEKSVDFLAKKPTASISKGSKSSTVVVKNANGTTVKVVRGSKATTKVATSNSYKVTLKGGTGTVKVYVNGVKVASK